MHIKTHKSLQNIPASQWNEMIPEGYPFLRHEFLYGLELTQCTNAATGWEGHHIVIYTDKSCSTILGALPCYLKSHSYGEYIFDWAWADAYQRAGLNYYPKLSCAIPFTPVTGPRWIINGTIDSDRQKIKNALIDKLTRCADSSNISSIHFLYTDTEHNEVLAKNNFIKRHSSQFHWQNNNYQKFSDFCACLSSKKRKNINRERRRVTEAKIKYQWFNGDSLSQEVVDVMFHFYCKTIHRYGAQQYLNQAFFRHIQKTLSSQTHILLAYYQEQPIAGGIYFSCDNALYGRYWGASDDFHSLHFETCYYQPIDYCIQQNIQRFEAGAQGEHKLSRGLLPTTTYSMHRLSDKRFHTAVTDYIDEEANHIKRYNQILNEHSPFKEI